MYLTMNRRLLALRFKSNFQPGKWDNAIQEHEEMIKALEARDGVRLGHLLRQHLLEKRDAVIKSLAMPEAARAGQEAKASPEAA
jgi:DNA-binding GntR family transcriptional regulator